MWEYPQTKIIALDAFMVTHISDAVLKIHDVMPNTFTMFNQ